VAKQYIVVEVEGGVVTETTGFGCDPEFIVVDWDTVDSDYDEAREKLDEIIKAGYEKSMSKIIHRLEEIIAAEDDEDDEDDMLG